MLLLSGKRSGSKCVSCRCACPRPALTIPLSCRTFRTGFVRGRVKIFRRICARWGCWDRCKCSTSWNSTTKCVGRLARVARLLVVARMLSNCTLPGSFLLYAWWQHVNNHLFIRDAEAPHGFPLMVQSINITKDALDVRTVEERRNVIGQ